MLKRVSKNLILAVILAVLATALVFSCAFGSDFAEFSGNGIEVAYAAATADSLTTLSIDGVAVNVSGDSATLVGDESEPRWVLDSGVLTLNGYDGGAIVAIGDLFVQLAPNSENKITTSSGNGLSVTASISGDGWLVLSGSGKLEIVSTANAAVVAAISASGGISIDGVTLVASATSNGADALTGIARAVYSPVGTITISSANITLNARGFEAYALNTGSSATDGSIKLTATTANITSDGTNNDTAVRVDGTEGNVTLVSGSLTTNSKKTGVLCSCFYMQGGAFTLNGKDFGIDARINTAISGGTLKIDVMNGTSVNGSAIRCQTGDLMISGADTAVFAEGKIFGLNVANNLTITDGDVKVITYQSGSYAVNIKSGEANISGGTVLLAGMSVALALSEGKKLTSHGVVIDANVVANQLLYCFSDGAVSGGERHLITIDGELYCQFEQVDKLATEGWKLAFSQQYARFILTLQNYNGAGFFSERSIEIVSVAGSSNHIVNALTSPVYTKGALYVGGSGFLEVKGGNGNYDSAIYASDSITISDANLVASAGGYGIDCYSGAVMISGGRVYASGEHYSIFSFGEFTIGEAKYNEEDFSASGIYYTDGGTLIKNDKVGGSEITALKVNGADVDISSDASGSGWFWVAALRYLTLNGYDGGFIHATGNLDLVVAKDTVNVINNMASGYVLLDNLNCYVGISASSTLEASGGGTLRIRAFGATTEDVSYAVYSYSTMLLSDLTLDAETSRAAIFTRVGTITLDKVVLTIEATGDAVTSYGDLTLTDCTLDVLSYGIGLLSKMARVLITGGDGEVHGLNRAVVARLKMTIGDAVYETGSLDSVSGSVILNWFKYADGVLSETKDKAILRVDGVYYDFNGDTIDKLATDGWAFEYDNNDAKYVMYLKNYDGNSILFTFGLEIVVLDGSTNSISFADNAEAGDSNCCVDVGGSLTLVGNGRINFMNGGESGGIGLLVGGKLTINGNLTLDTAEVVCGISTARLLFINADYVNGKYILANDVNVYGGTINISVDAQNCFNVTNFNMSGGSLTLQTTANSIIYACISAGGTIALSGGTLSATANGSNGVALKATGAIKLYSAFLTLYGGGKVLETGDLVYFGDKVLAFTGESAENATKARTVKASSRYLRTVEFNFNVADVSYDATNAVTKDDDLVIDLGDAFQYLELLRCNGKALVLGTDYLTDGTKIILKNSFIKSLYHGVRRLELGFGDDFFKTVSITVINPDNLEPTETARGFIVPTVLIAVDLLLTTALVCLVIFQKKKNYKNS